MRMRPHVNAGTQQKLRRAHLVEENEGPDHLSLRGWERSPHREAAKIARARYNYRVDCVACELVAWLGINGGLPAHVQLKATMGSILTLYRAGGARKPPMSALGK